MRTIFLGPDLALELGGPMFELADHVPEIDDLPGPLLGFKPPQLQR
jgi:hypothetical protein